MRVTQRVKAVADRLGKHPATVWRWIQRGCDIDSEQSINQFLEGNHHKRKGPRKHNPNTIRKRKRVSQVEPLTRRPPIFIRLNSGPWAGGVPRQLWQGWRKSKSVLIRDSCGPSNTATIRDQGVRNFICDRAKYYVDWIWRSRSQGVAKMSRFRSSWSNRSQRRSLDGFAPRSCNSFRLNPPL
jgi:hypothetical protein